MAFVRGKGGAVSKAGNTLVVHVPGPVGAQGPQGIPGPSGRTEIIERRIIEHKMVEQVVERRVPAVVVGRGISEREVNRTAEKETPVLGRPKGPAGQSSVVAIDDGTVVISLGETPTEVNKTLSRYGLHGNWELRQEIMRVLGIGEPKVVNWDRPVERVQLGAGTMVTLSNVVDTSALARKR